MPKITDFKIIDTRFITREEDAAEVLEEAKAFADAEIGLYSLEAKARRLTDIELQQHHLNGNHSLIELSIVVWEGYANDDLEEAKQWVQSRPTIANIDIYELNTRDMLPDEFEAFQACAPEYFEEKGD
jgi:hypothetical protein